MPAPGSPPPDDLVVEFRDRDGKVSARYDFAELKLPHDIAALLADAFRHHLAALAPRSRTQYWYRLQPFAQFANTDGNLTSLADLHSESILHYRTWLGAQTVPPDGTPLSQYTICSSLSVLRQLVNTAKRIHRSRLPASLSFPSHLVPRRSRPRPRNRLDEDALKALLGHCQFEIDQAVTRFRTAQMLLSGKRPVGSASDDVRLRNVLQTITRVTAKGYPSLEAFAAHGIPSGILREYGGQRRLLSFLFLTIDTAAPFFVMLLAELLGNVHPVLALTRDCVRDQPLLADRRIIAWEKPRAGWAKTKNATALLRYGAPGAGSRTSSRRTSLLAPTIN